MCSTLKKLVEEVVGSGCQGVGDFNRGASMSCILKMQQEHHRFLDARCKVGLWRALALSLLYATTDGRTYQTDQMLFSSPRTQMWLQAGVWQR